MISPRFQFPKFNSSEDTQQSVVFFKRNSRLRILNTYIFLLLNTIFSFYPPLPLPLTHMLYYNASIYTMPLNPGYRRGHIERIKRSSDLCWMFSVSLLQTLSRQWTAVFFYLGRQVCDSGHFRALSSRRLSCWGG